MDKQERLQLNKLINANDVEDVTQNIRDRKHSSIIKKDIDTMLILKRDYARLAVTSPETFNSMLENRSNFLFTNYFDIFNRVKKNELNLDIMGKFISILKMIEDEEIDQHTGAYHVGKLLKELYIDSAITRGNKIDEKYKNDESEVRTRPPPENISWAKYKHLYSGDDDISV